MIKIFHISKKKISLKYKKIDISTVTADNTEFINSDFQFEKVMEDHVIYYVTIKNICIFVNCSLVYYNNRINK